MANNKTLNMNTLTFRCISVNVNSMISNFKRMALLNLIDNNNPDLVFLCETKLNQRHVLYFKDFNMVRNDRGNNARGGGTAILIKKNFKFTIIKLHKEFESLESSIIVIKLTNNAKLYIISTYASKRNNNKFITEFQAIFEELNLNSPLNYYILAGDLNARHSSWSNSSNNERGITLNNWLEDNKIEYGINIYHTLHPSYPKNGSFLDLVFADARFEFTNTTHNRIYNIPFESDHEALLFSVESKDILADILYAPEPSRPNFNKAKWEVFTKTLEEVDFNIPNDRNLTLSEIDIFLEKINNKISEALEIAILKGNNINSTDKYINKEIRQLQKEKSKLLSQIHKLNRSFNTDRQTMKYLKVLKKKIKLVRLDLRSKIEESVSKYWFKRISKINPKESKRMFPEINKIFRKQNSFVLPTLKIPTKDKSLLDETNITTNLLTKASIDAEENYLITNLNNKLDIMGAHFASINNQNQNLGSRPLNNIVEKNGNKIKNDILKDKNSESTVCVFSENNLANNPKKIDNISQTKLKLQTNLKY